MAARSATTLRSALRSRTLNHARYMSYYPSEEPALPINTILNVVPQQEAWVVERFGRFQQILKPGLNVLVPLVDRIAYRHDLKEVAQEIPSQTAITSDVRLQLRHRSQQALLTSFVQNVSLSIDGILFTRVIDPERASYGVSNPNYAVAQLAQTLMRAEIGKMTLDRTLSERQSLNQNITESVNQAAKDWGIICLRYEIKDISPPITIVQSMHSQVAAERSKRASILEAEGMKQSAILKSEGAMAEVVNRAKGDAEATMLRAEAQAEALRRVAVAIDGKGGDAAVRLRVADSYLTSFGNIAKEGNTIIVPSNVADASGVIAQALAVWKSGAGAGGAGKP